MGKTDTDTQEVTEGSDIDSLDSYDALGWWNICTLWHSMNLKKDINLIYRKSFIDYIIFWVCDFDERQKKKSYWIMKSPNTLWIIIEGHYEELCVFTFLLFQIWVQILINVKEPFYGIFFFCCWFFFVICITFEVKYAEHYISLHYIKFNIYFHLASDKFSATYQRKWSHLFIKLFEILPALPDIYYINLNQNITELNMYAEGRVHPVKLLAASMQLLSAVEINDKDFLAPRYKWFFNVCESSLSLIFSLKAHLLCKNVLNISSALSSVCFKAQFLF